MTRVVVVDDHKTITEGIRLLLQTQGIAVVGTAADGRAALERVRELQPDLVLMDVRMKGMDGVAATEAIIAAGSDNEENHPKVLILTSYGDDDVVLGALRAGADGFVLKTSPPERLLEAVRKVAAGAYFLDPDVDGEVIRGLRASSPIRVSTSTLDKDLTQRERDTLILMANGLSNEEIAAEWVLSLATVKTHVSRVLFKTGCRNRTEAVILAYRHGLVKMPS